MMNLTNDQLPQDESVMKNETTAPEKVEMDNDTSTKHWMKTARYSTKPQELNRRNLKVNKPTKKYQNQGKEKQ